METQLHFDNCSKQLSLRFKERFRTDEGINFKVKGSLNTVTGAIESNFSLGTGRSDLRQRNSRRLRRGTRATFEFHKPELSLQGTYVPGPDELAYGLKAQQRTFAGPFWLKAKGAVQYRARSQKVSAHGDLQLCHTMYRFTDMQDVRLVLGCHAHADGRSTRGSLFNSVVPYGVVRENNWSLLTNFKGRWTVLYDL
ncbi:hypothetical protein WJX73_001386 [Symbiochloris irregularis]|uniref:Uncharacterized protein n=1 Tax=Symbiochloris irregularis TaxID=706552 RepID=A0AAW1PNS7_9CHLO